MTPEASDGYYHPASEEELRALIHKAQERGLKLRVRGAGHSEPSAFEAGATEINVLLDRMAAVQFNDEKMQVTVEAGCHLGYDPEDPSRTSTRENSLFAQLDRHGWALPDMGGITRQTVGGFLSTGSSGCSLQNSLSAQIVKMRLIDGTGTVRELARTENPDDPFYAAGVSMGLLGVITAVTLACVPRYNVEGDERTSGYADCAIDLFGNGTEDKPSLAAFLAREEHSRLIWWPQRGVQRMTVWRARKMPPQDDFKPKPYRQVQTILGSSYPAYLGISLALKALDSLNPPGPRGWLARNGEGMLALLYKLIAGQMLRPSRQEFRDVWWRGLPPDDGANYRLLPTAFAEILLPLSQTEEVMRRLRAHFEQGGFPATGIYAFELYPSPASKFWLSPAYDRPVLKFDPFWFKKSRNDPYRHFYPQFWQLLRDLDYRLHWGKAMPGDVDYARQHYPRWDDFMALREQWDPHQVFVTDYWRHHLAIAPA